MDTLAYPQMNETLYKEILDNGLTVYLLPKPGYHKTYGLFTTDYGSIDNEFVPLGSTEMTHVPDGIAHFLEHKMFEKEEGDVFQKFGQLGASANAFTSFTKTSYLFSTTDKLEENLKSGNIKVVATEGVKNEIANTKQIVANKAVNKQLSSTSQNIQGGNSNSTLSINDVQKAWKDILDRFKARRAMIIYASILTGRPVACSKGIVTIQFDSDYKLSKDRLDKAEYKSVINDIFSEVLREEVKVNFIVEEENKGEKRTEDILVETFGADLVDIIDE